MSTTTCLKCTTSWSGPGDLPTTCPECGYETALPAGYREAWDAWARASEAGEPRERLRELWAAVNAVLDNAEADGRCSAVSGDARPVTTTPATPTEAERQIAHEVWNEALCNHGIPGWNLTDAFAQALADQRARYEALAVELDPIEVALSGVDYVAERIRKVAGQA